MPSFSPVGDWSTSAPPNGASTSVFRQNRRLTDWDNTTIYRSRQRWDHHHVGNSYAFSSGGVLRRIGDWRSQGRADYAGRVVSRLGMGGI